MEWNGSVLVLFEGISAAILLIILVTVYQWKVYRILFVWCQNILRYSGKYLKNIFKRRKRTSTSLTENEDNFLRMYRLMSNVAPKAVRGKFNQYFPPSTLATTLGTEKNRITNRFFNRHIINKKQMSLLYPSSGITSSDNFDITLMICLLRNITTIVPPFNGFDKLPPVTEVSTGADLARIKCYRNDMAHAEKDELSNEDFNTMWICVSEAIIRLGGIAYKSKCEDVSQMNLNKDILGYIRQDLFEFRDQIKILTTKTVRNRSDISLLQVETSNIHNECRTQGTQISSMSKNVAMQIEDMALELKRNEEETIPKNIRAQHKQYIDEWTKDDKLFVITKATKYVKSSLKYKNNIIVVTGSSGNGKSSIIHHVALELHAKYGYELIPFVTGPLDIINFLNPKKNQVFVVDDICGKEAINRRSVEMWRDHLEKLEKIFKILKSDEKDGESKLHSTHLLVSCRLHVYRDSQFQLLKLFTKINCNLLSEELRLQWDEKMLMIKKYLPQEMIDPIELENFDFFPLLCKLSKGKSLDEIRKLFKSPDDTIKDDLKHFVIVQSHHGNYQSCALVLCILFVDGFNPDWLKLDFAPLSERDKINEIVNECNISIKREMSRKRLMSGFKTLELTYLKKRGNMYIMIHDKIHEIAALMYGKHLTECFIKYAPTSFVRDHYIFESFKLNANDNVIILPENMKEEYLCRMIRDLKEGDIIGTIRNRNLLLFRAEIINIFKHDREVRLALKKSSNGVDTSYYTTPLMEAASQGYHDIVKLLINLKCNVNYYNYVRKSALYKACEGGHTVVVKMLIENDAQVTLCDIDGLSPLHVSCLNGRTNVVKILLQKSFDTFMLRNFINPQFLSTSQKSNVDFIKLLKNSVHVSQVDQQGRSPLYLACKEGHTNIVKLLLRKNADVSKCNKRGQSSLHFACKGGYSKIVKLLLKQNAKVNKRCMDGRAALHLACKGGYLSIVKVLLEYRANISQKGWSGQTPLYEACEGGHIDVVRMLLKNHADINQGGQYGQSPLLVACEAGHPYIVKVLLENKASVFQCGKSGKSPLHMACKTGNADIVQLLLENGAKINQCDQRLQSPLFPACQEGCLDIVKILINTNNKTDYCDVHGQTPLHFACEGGNTDIVKLLLDNGAKVNQRGRDRQSPIFLACSNGHIDVVNVLLVNHADVLLRNKFNRPPVYVACEIGHVHIVRLLLEHKAEELDSDKFGMSPLHMACKGGHDEIVELLLKKNADVNQCDNYGRSPLYIACVGKNSQNYHFELTTCNERYWETACEIEHVQSVRLLLEHGAEVLKSDKFGKSPLHMACKGGHAEIVELLLKKNADVNQCDNHGQSPLHIACVGKNSTNNPFESTTCNERYREIVNILLEKKADVTLCDKRGLTPLNVAYGFGNSDIAYLIASKQ